MANFGTLKSRVLARVIDAPAAVSGDVGALVNQAIRDAQDLHKYRVMETQTALLPTSVGVRQFAAIPSDFKEYRTGEPPYLVRFDGRTLPLLVAPSREEALKVYAQGTLDPDDKGEPQVLVEGDPSDDLGTRAWEVYPLPDGLSDWSDGEYRIVVPYWRYLPELSADADTNWFTENLEWYIVYQATGHAFLIDWDEERAAAWFQLAAGQRALGQKADKLARLAGLDTLIPYSGARAVRLAR